MRVGCELGMAGLFESCKAWDGLAFLYILLTVLFTLSSTILGVSSDWWVWHTGGLFVFLSSRQRVSPVLNVFMCRVIIVVRFILYAGAICRVDSRVRSAVLFRSAVSLACLDSAVVGGLAFSSVYWPSFMLVLVSSLPADPLRVS